MPFKRPNLNPANAARGAEGQNVPTNELGAPSPSWSIPGAGMDAFGLNAVQFSYFDEREEAPDLQWQPGNNGSNRIYALMQADAQVRGLLMATMNPIRRFMWTIDPNGASAKVTKHISESLNLPVTGKEDTPRRGGFNHDRFLAQALQAPAYGHYYFERVYEQKSDGTFGLKGLYTRPPRTITNFVTDPHGELLGIIQLATGAVSPGIVTLGGVPIDVNRLLPFVWNPDDDGDWVGRSMLRPIYRNWYLKDVLLRLDASKHERNSMGIPWIETDASATPEQIASLAVIAEEMRSSRRGGAAGPGKMQLVGTSGSTSDPILSVKYHDQQMTSAFLAMFFELGKGETGSYSLGQALVDFHSEMIGTVADWYVESMQAQIEDEVQINWGRDEQPPRLRYTRLETSELAFADLALGVEKGIIAADPELHAYIGERWKIPGQAPEEIEAHEEAEAEKAAEKAEAFGLPAPGNVDEPDNEEVKDPPDVEEPKPLKAKSSPKRTALMSSLLTELTAPMEWAALTRAAGVDPKNGTARRARDKLIAEGAISIQGSKVAPLAGLALPDRELRRNPKPFEVEAAVNFAEMETVHVDAVANLVSAVKTAQGAQIAELTDAVAAAAGNGPKMATLTVKPVPTDLLTPALMAIARQGEEAAQQEYEAQVGAPPVSAAKIDTAAVIRKVTQRAQTAALTLANWLAGSASKKAATLTTLAPAVAAAKVNAHLKSLTDAQITERMSGAAQDAYNSGRFAVMTAREPVKVYASEILDANTCSNCASEDGTEFASIAESEEAYPGGGFVECEGGERCRGTLVAVYA